MAKPSILSAALLTLLLPVTLVSAQEQAAAAGTLFDGNGAAGAGPYELIDDYETSTFFSKFSYFSGYDDNYGHVQWVNESTATQNGYTKTTSDKTSIVGVDHTNVWPNGGPGRPSVRLVSINSYTHGLFVFDVRHAPGGVCGTWPALWLNGPHWPYTGEVDIYEGVNTVNFNTISLHSSSNCTISAGEGQSATFETSNCDEAANGNSGCGSQMDNSASPANNYGTSLNQAGGGYYITEWTSSFIKTWYFERNNVPSNVVDGTPDPSTFGMPAVWAQGECDIDSHFSNLSIYIHQDFCGAWAGQVYSSQYQNCPQTAGANSLDSCVDFVGNNPSAFASSYWEFGSIRVYQMPVGASAGTQSSVSLSSVTPAATSSNTVNKGEGPTASPVSSTYTGPLSSATTTTPSAAPTPVICPTQNNTEWSDTNAQKYNIGCGMDFASSTNLAVVTAMSFENCMEICDISNSCVGVAFIGGNGAGTCYTKSAISEVIYKGAPNAAARVNGAVSLSSSVSTSLNTIQARSAHQVSPTSFQIISTGLTGPPRPPNRPGHSSQ